MLETNELVGYWKLEGNSNDCSSSGNNGADTDITYQAGKFGKDADFNKVSSKIVLTTTLNRVGYTAFSCGGWIKADSHAAGLGIIFTSANDVGLADKWQFALYISTANKAIATVRTGGANIAATSTTAINGAWHHVYFVLDGTNLKIYIDGVAEDTKVCGAPDKNPAGLTTSMGASNNSGVGYEYFFGGEIDEFQVYDYGLSAVNVKRLMLGLHPLGR